MQHGPWSGATRAAPASREPETYLVIYQRGGVTSSKLDGFCRIIDGRLRLCDGSGDHANLLASRPFSEVAASFLAHDFVMLQAGYRVQWSGDTLASLLEPVMQSPAPTKKRRLTLGVRQGAPVVEPSGQLPRPASTSTASTICYSPTSAAASGKGGVAVPHSHATAPHLACSATSVAGSASSWLPQDHPNHSAQMSQFVAASCTLQRHGLIASPRHPEGASIAAALRQTEIFS